MPVLVQGKVHRDKIDGRNVLWRYMDLTKFMDMIQNRTLFFTRADRFEDKYEGSFTKSIKEKIESAFLEKDLSSSYDEFKTKLRERVYINCWHKSVHDSMAMWKIYGSPIHGVAITTTVKKLENALTKHIFAPQSDSYLFKVDYVNHWRDPAIDINPYSRIFSYKLKAYSYENEVRAVIDSYHQTYDNDPIENFGLSIPIDFETLVRSIVIAPDAPDWFISLIHNILKTYNITTPIHRSKLSFAPV